MIANVSVLFARQDSVYKSLCPDVYDELRDARSFARTNPVICHPPCAQWSRLRAFARQDEHMRSHAPWSVQLVRTNGGVLEHPEHSLLWKEEKLPMPGSIDEFGGFTVSVNQSWFGHPCRKRTFLYICGISPAQLPDYPITFDAVEYTITKPDKRRPNNIPKKVVTRAQREHTPVKFAEWLISIASLCAARP